MGFISYEAFKKKIRVQELDVYPKLEGIRKKKKGMRNKKTCHYRRYYYGMEKSRIIPTNLYQYGNFELETCNPIQIIRFNP